MAHWTRMLPEDPAGGGEQEGHTAHRWTSTYVLGVGRTTIMLSQLKEVCPISTGKGGKPWQEREFWKGVAWLRQVVYLSRHPRLQEYHFSLKPSSVHSPEQGAQGCPLSEAGEFLLPPPSSAGSQEALPQPFFAAYLVSTLMKSPSLRCCPASGWQGGSQGCRLLSMAL